MWLAALRGLKEPIPAGALCSVLPSPPFSITPGTLETVQGFLTWEVSHCYIVTVLHCYLAATSHPLWGCAQWDHFAACLVLCT